MDGQHQRERPDGNGRINPYMAAALVGGGLAASAGAWFGTRALARKNRSDGRPLNSVMATAITACDLAHAKPPTEPKVTTEPRVPAEPVV